MYLSFTLLSLLLRVRAAAEILAVRAAIRASIRLVVAATSAAVGTLVRRTARACTRLEFANTLAVEGSIQMSGDIGRGGAGRGSRMSGDIGRGRREGTTRGRDIAAQRSRTRAAVGRDLGCVGMVEGLVEAVRAIKREDIVKNV